MVIVYIPGDFLTADQYDAIGTTLRGELSKIMVRTAPEVYRKYVIIEKW